MEVRILPSRGTLKAILPVTTTAWPSGFRQKDPLRMAGRRMAMVMIIQVVILIGRAHRMPVIHLICWSGSSNQAIKRAVLVFDLAIGIIQPGTLFYSGS